MAYFCASNKLLTKIELSTGKSLYKQSQTSEETFINIKSIPSIHGIFCLSNLNKLYLILSPPYYNKSKCILEIDLSGLGLIENSNEESIDDNLQEFAIQLEAKEKMVQGESQSIKIDLREEVLKKKDNFLSFQSNFRVDFEEAHLLTNNSLLEKVSKKEDSQSRRHSKKEKEERQFLKNFKKGEEGKSFKENLNSSSFNQRMTNSKNIRLAIPRRSIEPTSKEKGFQTMHLQQSKKNSIRQFAKTDNVGRSSRMNRDLYKFKFSNRTKDIHSNAELNKIFDHFFVKVMEVYSSGQKNPMYQNKFYSKKAEDFKSDPERLKRDLEKNNMAKLTKKIYEKVYNIQEDIFEEEKFIDGLFLGKKINCSFGRR